MEAFLLMLGFALVAGIALGIKKRREIESARTDYQRELDELRDDPTNPHRRESALAAGRRYADLGRNRKGVTTFDEVALSNDIAAACANATPAPRAPQMTKAGASSVEDRLRKLTDLRDRGIVSPEEYAARRERILDEL